MSYMRRVQLRVAALATLGVWTGQGLLLFGLAVHLAQDHQVLHSNSADLSSFLHGHDHGEGTPEHSHETLPAESSGGPSRQTHLWLGLLSFAPRNGPAPFPNEVVMGPTATQAALGHVRTTGPSFDLRPPLYDLLCILLI